MRTLWGPGSTMNMQWNNKYMTITYLSGLPDKFGLEGFVFGNKRGTPVKQGTGMWTAQTEHFAHYCAQSSCCCKATYIYGILLHVFPGRKDMSLITVVTRLQAVQTNYHNSDMIPPCWCINTNHSHTQLVACH